MSTNSISVQKLIVRQLYSQFVIQAQRKLSELEFEGLDQNDDLSVTLIKGVDLEFDSKLESLALITKHCPKIIIDSIMIWRSIRKVPSSEVMESQLKRYPMFSLQDFENRVRKRNSLISNFILCRALMAILQLLEHDQLGDELGKKLEDMIFAQLRSSDPEQLERYINLKANVMFFSQLMGTLSKIRYHRPMDCCS